MMFIDFMKSRSKPSAELPKTDGLYLIQRPTDDDCDDSPEIGLLCGGGRDWLWFGDEVSQTNTFEGDCDSYDGGFERGTLFVMLAIRDEMEIDLRDLRGLQYER